MGHWQPSAALPTALEWLTGRVKVAAPLSFGVADISNTLFRGTADLGFVSVTGEWSGLLENATQLLNQIYTSYCRTGYTGHTTSQGWHPETTGESPTRRSNGRR